LCAEDVAVTCFADLDCHHIHMSINKLADHGAELVWEADRSSASQEIFLTACYPKFRYCVHNCPTLALSWATSNRSSV